MSIRVYVLLDIREERLYQVAQTLQSKPGVVMADVLESPPGVMVVVEACQRQRLAELTIQALASVDVMTEGLQLMPTRDRCNTYTVTKPLRTTTTNRIKIRKVQQ